MADPCAVLVLDAHLAYLSDLTVKGDGSTVDRAGLVAFRSRASMPFLVNCVARTDVATSPSVVLETAASTFGTRGFEVLCLEGRDEDLRRTAIVSGGRAGGHGDPLQFLDTPLATSSPKRYGVDVRIAQGVADVADIIGVMEDSHAVYEFPKGFFATIFGSPNTILSSSIHAVIVAERGVPVACAQTVLVGELAYIGWVAVARAAMRRGLGRLVTEEAVRAGFERGASYAGLLASPMGAPLYRTLGFVDVGMLRNVSVPSGESLRLVQG